MIQTEDIENHYRADAVRYDQLPVAGNILSVNMGVDEVEAEHQCQKVSPRYEDNIKNSEGNSPHDPLFIVF